MEEKFLKRTYRKQYKKLLLIPMLLLVLSMVQIGVQIATTGDFINKGVSLKGGLTFTIDKKVNIGGLNDLLTNEFPDADISVRSINKAGSQVGTIVEASDIDEEKLTVLLEKELKLTKEQYSIEVMGSALGASFFQETFRIVMIAFLFMGLVVFLYFGENTKSKLMAGLLTFIIIPTIYLGSTIIIYLITLVLVGILIYIYLKYSIPSFAVILSAFTDIIVTVALVNLLGMKLSTAGIAAFLMLIGYSVDTDVLLCTKVMKGKSGTIFDRILEAMKTGLTMSLTTMVAITAALSFTQSDILKQIMTILLLGLIVDLSSTWLQNAGILRIYLEKKHHE